MAAKQMGRSYIGVEIDPYYRSIAQEKMDNARPVTLGNAYVSIHLGKIASIRDCDLEEVPSARRNGAGKVVSPRIETRHVTVSTLL